jgi:hypothetical protein
MGREANYRVHGERLGGSVVLIEDIGPWDQHLTVTNDAEGVIERLYASGELKRFQRLFYYDSEGDISELVISADGVFQGFYVCQPQEDIWK